MISTDLAIDIKDVQKTYRGKVRALRGVAMHVRRGEVYGLLGPNGAGKSTLVKIIMTVVRPTVVDGKVLGAPVGDKPTLARIGYLPENHRFPRYLTGRQVLDLFSALSGLPRKGRLSRADELLEIVGMSAWGDRKIGTYSKGMMQRVGLAQAMMHNPDLILLDEPTDGVDPVGRKEIRDVLLRLKQQGVSVLINSHLLSELEMISDRVGIIVNGSVARQGTLEELALGRGHFEIQIAGALPASIGAGELERFGASPPLPFVLKGERVGVRVPDPATKTDVSDAPGPPPLTPALSPAYGGEGVKRLVPEGASAMSDIIRVDTTDPAGIQPVIDVLRRNAVTIVGVRLIRPTLEQLFMEAVMEQTGGGSYMAGANLGRGFPVGVRA